MLIYARELECKYVISMHTVLRNFRQIYEFIDYLYLIKMLFTILSAYIYVGLSNIAHIYLFFGGKKHKTKQKKTLRINKLFP